MQTPQAFRLDALRSAYDQWNGPSPTDETTVVRAARMKVAAVAGDPALEKLTLPSDFERAEEWLAGRLIPRTGMGFDVHAFSGDGPIMLGEAMVHGDLWFRAYRTAVEYEGVQHQVDRRFNRRKYSAARTIEADSVRLRDQLDLDTLSGELLAVVDQTMEPTRVSLWLRPSAPGSSGTARSAAQPTNWAY